MPQENNHATSHSHPEDESQDQNLIDHHESEVTRDLRRENTQLKDIIKHLQATNASLEEMNISQSGLISRLDSAVASHVRRERKLRALVNSLVDSYFQLED